ncbi:MAG: RICIN domain-containing protein [Bacteroidota bacterium]
MNPPAEKSPGHDLLDKSPFSWTTWGSKDPTNKANYQADNDDHLKDACGIGFNSPISTKSDNGPLWQSSLTHSIGRSLNVDCEGNLLQNGDFSAGAEKWGTFINPTGAIGVASFNNNQLQLELTEGGVNDNSIQLFQNGVMLEDKTEYTVSFQAQCATVTRNMACIIQDADSNWLRYFLTTISPEEKTYSFTYNSLGNEEAARIVFYLGGQGSNTIILDNICMLADESDSTSIEIPDPTYFHISNRTSGKKLSPVSDDSNVNTQLTPVANNDDLSQWEQIASTGNYFYLKNKDSRKFLRVESNVDDALVKSSIIADNLAEWTTELTDNGFFYLINRATGKYITGTEDVNNAPIIQKPTSITGTETQWTFEEVQLSVSIDNLQTEKNITPYPIPVGNQLFLDHAEDGQLTIFTLDGKATVETAYRKDQAVDVSKLPAGVYGLRLMSRSGRLFIGKILKH